MMVRHLAVTATDATEAPAESTSSISCDSESSNDGPRQKTKDKKTNKRKRVRPTLNAVDFIDDAAVLSGSEISDDSGEGLEGDEDGYEEDGFLVFSDEEDEEESRRRRIKKKKRSGRGRKKRFDLELNEDDLLLIHDAGGNVIQKNHLAPENGRQLTQKDKHQRREEQRAKGQRFQDKERNCCSLEKKSLEEACEIEDSESLRGTGVLHRRKVSKVYARERRFGSDGPLKQRKAAAGQKSTREQQAKSVQLRRIGKNPRQGAKTQSPNENDSFLGSRPRKPKQTLRPDQARKVQHKSHSYTEMQVKPPGGLQSFHDFHRFSHNSDGRCQEQRSSKLGLRQRSPAQLVEPAHCSCQPAFGLASLEPSTQELTSGFTKTSLPSHQKAFRQTSNVNHHHDRSIVLPSTTQHHPSSVYTATSGSAKPAARVPRKKTSPTKLSRPQVGVGEPHVRHLSKVRWQAGKDIDELRSHPSPASLMQRKSGLSNSGSQCDTTGHKQSSVHDPCRRFHANSKRASVLNHLAPNCATKKVGDQIPTAPMRVQGSDKKKNTIESV